MFLTESGWGWGESELKENMMNFYYYLNRWKTCRDVPIADVGAKLAIENGAINFCGAHLEAAGAGSCRPA